MLRRVRTRRFQLLAIASVLPVLLTSVLVGISATLPQLGRAAGTGPTPTPTPFVCPGPWYHIASPNPGANANLLTSVAAVTPDDIWAVGGYQDVLYGSAHRLIQHWDGTSWSTVPSPSRDGEADGLTGVAAVSAADVWAVSAGGIIEHWDGTAWSLVPSALPAAPGSYPAFGGVAALSTNDVWAVGHYINQGFFQTIVEHWNGTNWTIVPSPNVDGSGVLMAVTTLSPTNVWAVGYYRRLGAYEKRTLVEHWDGTSWSVVPSPNFSPYYDDQIYAVAAQSATDIWAVGSTTLGGQWPVLHWDGSTWSIVPVPTPQPPFGISALNGVAITPNGEVWAVGGPVTLHWDGTAWTFVPIPGDVRANGYLAAVVALSPQHLWAVGYNNPAVSTHQQTLTVEYRPPAVPIPGDTPTPGIDTQCPHSTV
jgi:hypothetical protein